MHKGRAGAVGLCAALALALSPASPARAQSAPPRVGGPVASPVLTLNQERLYRESRFGRRVQAELEAAAQALAAENRRIEAELLAEEERLTRQREAMDPAEFRALAEAFDRKVEEIRRRQDAKQQELQARAEAERKRFFEAAYPVLLQLVADLGAVAILDSRAVVLALAQVDITDAAIRRVDLAVGDGTTGTTPAGASDSRAGSGTDSGAGAQAGNGTGGGSGGAATGGAAPAD